MTYHFHLQSKYLWAGRKKRTQAPMTYFLRDLEHCCVTTQCRPQFSPENCVARGHPADFQVTLKSSLHRTHLVLDIQPLWPISFRQLLYHVPVPPLLSNLSYANRYNQSLCLVTADQTWNWSYLLAHIHTDIFSVFTAYNGCTHLQAVSNRINYFAGFIILFHKKK